MVKPFFQLQSPTKLFRRMFHAQIHQQNIGGAEPSVQIIGGAQASLPIGVYAYVGIRKTLMQRNWRKIPDLPAQLAGT
jgi:hypothetical protein